MHHARATMCGAPPAHPHRTPWRNTLRMFKLTRAAWQPGQAQEVHPQVLQNVPDLSTASSVPLQLVQQLCWSVDLSLHYLPVVRARECVCADGVCGSSRFAMAHRLPRCAMVNCVYLVCVVVQAKLVSDFVGCSCLATAASSASANLFANSLSWMALLAIASRRL